ncbi:hypothetical protein [Streptomyces sp. NBC_00057]|uniref:hypothetical protein n=1 Tax=Streptomyces sp. NBC_00057 TaxID=2975634 RepID=UPI0032535A87
MIGRVGTRTVHDREQYSRGRWGESGRGCAHQAVAGRDDGSSLRTERLPRFVEQYADMHGVLLDATQDFAADVAAGTSPEPEHAF